MPQINTRLVLRNDTKSNWEAVKNTATLKVGEFGIESDTGLFKIGAQRVVDGSPVFETDGITPVLCTWAELPYANDIPEIDLSTVENKVTIKATYAELPTEGNNVGDIGIVKAVLYDDTSDTNADLYTYTSYVWGQTADSFAWMAMDGNYNASNVYFDKDLTYTASIGALKLESGKNSDTYAAKGKSLEAVIRRIMAETISPTITQPSYSLAKVGYKADNANEVGSKITALTWDGTYSDGSYSYGRSSTADGGEGNVSTTTAAGCSATYSVQCDLAGTTNDGNKVDGTYTLTTPF